MRILAIHRQNSGCGYYRQWLPACTLRSLGHEVTSFEYTSFPHCLRPEKEPKDRSLRPSQWFIEHIGKADLLLVDRAIAHHHWGWFAGWRHASPGARMICDFDDDFTNVPIWNPAHNDYHPGQEPHDASFMHMQMSELTTVSTPPLVEGFRKHSHAIKLAPNRIDPTDWADLPRDPARTADPHLRVMYGGAAGHWHDLEAARPGFEAVLRNPPVPMRLICFGALPAWLYDLAKEIPGRVVTLPWVPLTDYPQAVAWGGFDLALAPLAAHPFNESKSNIKWLESSMQGIPLLCSDVGPYSEIPDDCVIKVANTPVQWAEALRETLKDESLRGRLVTRSKQAVYDEWTLDRGAENWQNVIEEAMSRPRIETEEDTNLPQ